MIITRKLFVVYCRTWTQNKYDVYARFVRPRWGGPYYYNKEMFDHEPGDIKMYIRERYTNYHSGLEYITIGKKHK